MRCGVVWSGPVGERRGWGVEEGVVVGGGDAARLALGSRFPPSPPLPLGLAIILPVLLPI